MGDEEVYKISIRKPERKRPCERPRHRWEDLREIGFGGVD
jgi:hypothetical protein